MKVRVKELSDIDKTIGIGVGDVFEVVESNSNGYYVDLETGFLYRKLGDKRHWYFLETQVEVLINKKYDEDTLLELVKRLEFHKCMTPEVDRVVIEMLKENKDEN